MAVVLTCSISLPSVASLAAPAPQLFAERCAMCHQANGAGLLGQFPRLAGRVNVIAQSPAGRRYLVLLLLNGMVGPIDVDSQHISGLMPSMAALKDEDIAAMLNYATQLGTPAKKGKIAAFSAAEIAVVRKGGSIGPSAVHAERAKLVASGALH
ncbi:c-type cytochrome [Sphingomonas bacterium]|uniref:c-type cytochrome n=1 Tax=Sphingomonas bacterium TaxID=1895847 RepID=UPI0020C5F6AB|nr:cytochrome c [Sphingomonas bacterium]